MSHLVYQTEIWAQFGLISIRDFETEDNPVAITGEEEVVAAPGHIFVSARPDLEGEVSIEVHVGEPDITDARLVFNDTMTFASTALCITDPTVPDEESMQIPHPGRFAVKIFTIGTPNPGRVLICFDPDEWNAIA
ncbi:hypothetical protein [Streptomyces zhihengii]